MVTTYVCRTCGKDKPKEDFYKHKSKLGHGFDCKCCKNKKVEDLRKDKALNDLCRYCDKPRLKGSKQCLYHLVRGICRNSDIDISKIDDLIKKLYNQNFSCYYTQTLLIPGVNLSIDHIVPRSKSGNDDLDNLVWCDYAVNKMKCNTDLDSFLSNSKNTIEELTYLASIETPEQRSARLNYVLGLN